MLSLAKLGRGREDYYLRAVGADATEYYSERGEVAGRWLGGGAEALGLEGRVHDRPLLALLAGYAPDAVRGEEGWKGERLVAPPSKGRRMPGLDACYMAPKSVSLLWAFGDQVTVGDRTLDKVIEDAHDEAVRESLRYLEAEAAKGRRGHDGLDQISTSGYVAAAFRHRSSRADDPHLHTHVVLVNACQGSDGRWGALDARLSYIYAKSAGYLYAAHLRHVLDRELGVEWREVENGIADVSGVPEEMITLFSRRSQELRGALEQVTSRVNQQRIQLGLDPVEAESQEALDLAANQTRGAKLYHVATHDLRAAWRQRAAEAGQDLDQLAPTLHRSGDREAEEDEAERYHRVAAGLTENASTFGERDAVQGLAADARQGAPVAEVLRRTSALLASSEVVEVASAGVRSQDVIQRDDGVVAPVPTPEGRWSTPDLLAIEERLVDEGVRRQREGAATLPEAVLMETIRESAQLMPSLGADQVQMVAGLATSGAGVECVEAGPGSGKTTALGIYLAACWRAGVRVIGCAPSARARDVLRQEARLEPCYTMAKLLLELEQDRLAPGSVIVLDEASMAGTRPLAELLQHASASRAKVVLVGDRKQLSSVDAGGGFRGLVRRLGAHHLIENRRQEAEWERAALRQLRDGSVEAALKGYADHGRLHIGDREELLPLMLDMWWEARATGEAVMQAVRWRDVTELNERARARLVGAGLVEREGVDVRGLTIGVGDRVMVMRNARELGVINGTTGTVVEVDVGAGRLGIETSGPERRRIELPKEFWAAKGRRRLALDYCRTIHKAQGATYQGASFTLAGDDCIHLEAAHVALSRATEANHLFYVGEPPPHEEHHVPEVEPPEFPGLVGSVSRSRAQVLALDILQQLEPPNPAAKARPDGGWANVPMTEAQVATLARLGAAPERDLTWVEASLLIDDATGQPAGRKARGWLQERGLSEEQADEIIEAAKRSLRQPSARRLTSAVADRLEEVESARRTGRPLSAGRRQESEALERWQSGAARNRQRQQRRQWAEQQPTGHAPPPPTPGPERRPISRQP